jgi:nucleoside-diphosphate-sugar epimerase
MPQNPGPNETADTRPRVVLVVGATGVIGRHFLELAEDLPGWRLVGAQRRPPPAHGPTTYCAVDLLDAGAAVQALAAHSDITEIVYAGYVHGTGWQSETEANLTLMRNAVTAVEAAGAPLRRVILLQGMKYYGSHLGPFRTPARESDPRHIPPNFYYDQQDFLIEQSRGKAWDWTCLRPHVVCGSTPGSPLNLIALIGAYAVMCRELGLPLKFPGQTAAFATVTQATDARLLAKAIRWAIETPACGNEAFNITNGDFFRWKNLWPRIADFFDMECGDIQTIDLNAFMTPKADLWRQIAVKHGLRTEAMDDFVYWPFGNYVFSLNWDVMASTIKARRFGFNEFVDSEDMFLEIFRTMQSQHLLPR